MPVFGLGLHILVAIFFAVHAVRRGRELYWLLILFSFPLLGSLVYFFAVYLPSSRLEHGARKAVAAAGRMLDPGRELREARDAFNFTPTAQNQMRLAAALLEAGEAAEAATTYEACLQGAFGSDLEIRLGAARANLAVGAHDKTIQHLEFIRRTDANYRAEQCSLLLAKAFAAANRNDEARAEFENAVDRFGSFDARAEFAIWAAGMREYQLAKRLQSELQHTMDRWNRHTASMNDATVRRLNAAFAQVPRS
ncbi:hypothetical protein [Duganella sp. Root1480D1]|uniref:hypothetical protein n=1 Tax=Duganella sp. Root1480D1 TaxID=1736471 RepID=UPI00070FFD67|nr:hypothetical protein [Duganella sp. Root1480D1]KQZ44004.1 hypothetical protein ASD58_19860 [Duganella sp. Root1480D1]